MKNVRVRVSGRVQGVWFRANTKQKADILGVKGWVKNTSDGCVEAIFEGDEKLVDEMVDWCKRGPPLAKVENVDVKTQNISSFDAFEIKR